MKSESMEYIKKVLAMDEIVQNLNETLDEYGKKIEIEKLRAIGEVQWLSGQEEEQSGDRVRQQEEEVNGVIKYSE